jgi:hypothetical protein
MKSAEIDRVLSGFRVRVRVKTTEGLRLGIEMNRESAPRSTLNNSLSLRDRRLKFFLNSFHEQRATFGSKQ